MNFLLFIVVFIGLGILIFVFMFFIVGIIFFWWYLKILNGLKLFWMFGMCIILKELLEFVIFLYILIVEESDGGEIMSEYGENIIEEDIVKFFFFFFRRVFLMLFGLLGNK